MGTKMKGLLKGLRYITQIFDEEKEQEIQIGYPTDVKHVAHIGMDGPSVDSPSWINEFKSPQGVQSAPLSVNGKSKENPEINWVSQDSRKSQNSPTKDFLELPKSSRRHSLADSSSSTSESPNQESSTKPRQSRRNSSSSSKGTRQPKGSSLGSGSGLDPPSQSLPDIPKKSLRKKSKELVGGRSSRSSRSKVVIPPPTPYTSPFSDPGPDTKSIPGSNSSELIRTSSLRSPIKE